MKFNKLWVKVVLTIVLSVLLFLVFGFVTYVIAFVGRNYIEGEWDQDEYTVQYIRSQGFSGRPALYYQVIHKPFGGLFEKVLDERVMYDETIRCVVVFEEEGIEVDICK